MWLVIDIMLSLLQGTYYGIGENRQGACGFGQNGANSTHQPWSTGTTLTVAINDAQYSGGVTCGMCIKFRGVGTGIGTQPIPQTWQYALVDNRFVPALASVCNTCHDACHREACPSLDASYSSQ